MTAALIAKLESASEGSRELDFWIAYELGLMAGIVPVRPSTVREGHGEVCLLDANGKSLGWVGYHVSPPVTTSIDAALALAERVLPDAEVIAISRVRSSGWGAGINGHVAYTHPPALALCIALLRASAAEGAE